jgi:sugar phosphate isomerase/epimerase
LPFRGAFGRLAAMSHSLPTRSFCIGALAVVFAFFRGSIAEAGPAGIGPGFKGPVGLQFESLGSQFGRDVPRTLDEVRDFGFKYVELVGAYNLPPEKFKAELDARGLEPVSCHYSYQRCRDDVEGIARDAKILGFKYVVCRSIPHDKPVDENTIRDAINVFNRAGEALAKHGLKFAYHPHGYEFKPRGDGTLFDLLMTETNPQFVHYQMDIFWIVHAGQDPVKLLEKYGKRWDTMHLKDMKKGTQTGLLTGKSDGANDVVLGTGQIDLPAVLRAAKTTGIAWYFIEDESPWAERQIPQSLHYLEQVK